MKTLRLLRHVPWGELHWFLLGCIVALVMDLKEEALRWLRDAVKGSS